MRIEMLENFLAVSEEESISVAAQKMHISQPALSHQMQALEKELGVRLFVRDVRRIKLTEAGLTLQRKAMEMAALYRGLKQDIAGETIEGKIRLGCGELASMDQLSDAIAAFAQKYPRVSFHFLSVNADAALTLMDQGELDLALVMEPIFFEKYHFLRFPAKEEWVCCLRRDDPLAEKAALTPEELAGSRVILPYRSSVANVVLNWFGEYGSTLQIAGSSSFYSNAVVMVKKGVGRAIYIRRQAPYPCDAEIVQVPLKPGIRVSSSLIWNKEYQSAEVRRFLQFLIQFSNT